MLQETLKPLIISMKIVGLYSVSFTSKLEPTKTEPMETKRMEKRLKGIFNLKTYNFLVMVLVSVNFFRYIAGLLPVDSKLTSRIILLMWFGLVALCSIVMFISCQRSSHLQAFYTRWNNVCERANSVFVNLKFSRFIRIGTVISWLSVLTDITAIAVLFALSGMDFKHQSIRPFSVSATSICVAGVTVTFASGIITFSISFVIYVCHIIKSSFDQLSEYLRRQIKDGGERIPKCLKECRQLHVDLCECVTILDRTFGMLIAILLAVNLLLVCFILYQIVNFTLSLAMMMVCILWLTSSVATILGVTISTALVHEAAHSPMDHIFKLQSLGASTDESIQVNLFLGQLTGRSIGFTVMGMFVITKEVLLTIAGLFMTYFFLLLQFRIS